MLYIQYIFSSHRPGGFLSFLRREFVRQSNCELIKVFQKLQASVYFSLSFTGFDKIKLGVSMWKWVLASELEVNTDIW